MSRIRRRGTDGHSSQTTLSRSPATAVQGRYAPAVTELASIASLDRARERGAPGRDHRDRAGVRRPAPGSYRGGVQPCSGARRLRFAGTEVVGSPSPSAGRPTPAPVHRGAARAPSAYTWVRRESRHRRITASAAWQPGIEAGRVVGRGGDGDPTTSVSAQRDLGYAYDLRTSSSHEPERPTARPARPRSQRLIVSRRRCTSRGSARRGIAPCRSRRRCGAGTRASRRRAPRRARCPRAGHACRCRPSTRRARWPCCSG